MPMTTPHDQYTLSKVISQKYQANDLRAALSLCHQLNTQYDNFHHGWYLASILMHTVRNHRDALSAIEKAMSLHFSEKYLLQKSQCQFSLGELSAAKSSAEKLEKATFKTADLHHALGDLFNKLSHYKKALKQFDKAIAIDPQPATFYFNKATMQRYLGDIDGADKNFSIAIAKRPDDYEAYASRSNLRTQTADHNNIDQLLTVINSVEKSGKNQTGIAQLYYALAKEYEDLMQHQKSFRALHSGARKKRSLMKYDIQKDLDILDAIRKSYNEKLFSRNIEGSSQSDPIFILGMPRTGTTLVERILDSHDSIQSIGEVNDFALTMIREAKNGSRKPKSQLDLIEKSTELNFSELGNAYLESVRAKRDDSTYFIDKLPFNYLYIGLIHLALPNAKIINLQRHPIDTCYSVYKQLFKDAYPFSYSLKELGQYYVAYHQLMNHWHKVMPGLIHTVNYEELVADTETEARKLLRYCELPWQDKCLRFHENRSASTTASAVQVREKVYTTSVNQWENYREQLQPLIEILRSNSIDC